MTPEQIKTFLDALDDQQSAEALAYLMNRNGGVQSQSTTGGPTTPPPTGGGH